MRREAIRKSDVSRNFDVLGQFTWLFMKSKYHSEYDLGNLARVSIPPIDLNQFLLYTKNGCPIGVVTWAWLNKCIEQNFVTGKKHLMPDDWNSGNQLWIIDFIAPFGHAKIIISDLRNNIFSENSASAMRRNCSKRRIINIKGCNFHEI